MPRLPVELTDLILASLDPLADARTHSACALAARALLWQTRRLRFATITVDRSSAATLLRLATAARVLACVRDLRVCDGPGTWTPSELGAFLAAFPAELRVRKLRLVGLRITDTLLAAVATRLGAIEHLCYDRCIAALDRTELVLLVWPFLALKVLALKGMALRPSPNVSAKNEEFMKLPRPHKLSKLSIHEHSDQDPFVPAFLESIMTHDLYRGIRHLCLDGSAGYHDETDKLAKFMSYVGPNLLSLALGLDDRGITTYRTLALRDGQIVSTCPALRKFTLLSTPLPIAPWLPSLLSALPPSLTALTFTFFVDSLLTPPSPPATPADPTRASSTLPALRRVQLALVGPDAQALAAADAALTPHVQALLAGTRGRGRGAPPPSVRVQRAQTRRAC